MEEGRHFMLAKKGLEDTGAPAKLEEMPYAISNPIEVLGGDVSLPQLFLLKDLFRI